MWASEWKWSDVWEVLKPGLIIGLLLGGIAFGGIIIFHNHVEGEARKTERSLDVELRMYQADRLRDLKARAEGLEEELKRLRAIENDEVIRLTNDKRKELAEVRKEYIRIRRAEQKIGNGFCSDLPLEIPVREK